MQRLARFVIQFVYYCGLAVGMINFQFDFRALRPRVTRFSTVYTLAANSAVLCLLPMLCHSQLVRQMLQRTRYLYNTLYYVITALRICFVVLTIVSNWLRRPQHVALVRDFVRLHRRHFRQLYAGNKRAAALFTAGVVRKFMWSMLTECFVATIMLNAFVKSFTWQTVVHTVTLNTLLALPKMLFCFYYFAMLHVQVHYHLLAAELAAILRAARAMVARRRLGGGVGVYITQCCQLADRLDALAVAERGLHDICDRINAVFALQGCSFYLIMYLSNISFIYYIFTLVRVTTNYFVWSNVGFFIIIAAVCLAYVDFYISIDAMFQTQQLHKSCAELLRGYLLLPLLDVRLETSFQGLMMQLQQRPLELNMLGMFDFRKLLLISWLGSLVENSLLLIQIDLKNYKQTN